MRIRLLIAGVVLAALLIVSGCGSDEEGGGTAASSTGTATTAATGPEPGAYPVTIEHRHGSTTIEREPERVVVVGLREQDALLALGKVPVGTTEWFGEHPGAIFPWATDELGEAPAPTVLDSTDGVPVEKVASLRPDLILGVYSGLTKKEYELLSKIAPVVAQPKDKVDYGSSWQQDTLITGRAIGRPKKAQELVDATEKLIADTAAQHPEFKDLTGALITDYQGIFVYGPQDARTTMLEALGFTFPGALRKVTPDQFGGQLSEEHMDDLDVGVLVWFADGDRSVDDLKSDPLYRKLNVRKEGRDVFVLADDRVYEPMSFPSVLSMPTLLDELVPRLAAAADGDPSTSTDQQPAG